MVVGGILPSPAAPQEGQHDLVCTDSRAGLGPRGGGASAVQIPSPSWQPPKALSTLTHTLPCPSTNWRPTLMMSEMPLSLRLFTKVSRG